MNCRADSRSNPPHVFAMALTIACTLDGLLQVASGAHSPYSLIKSLPIGGFVEIDKLNDVDGAMGRLKAILDLIG